MAQPPADPSLLSDPEWRSPIDAHRWQADIVAQRPRAWRSLSPSGSRCQPGSGRIDGMVAQASLRVRQPTVVCRRDGFGDDGSAITMNNENTLSILLSSDPFRGGDMFPKGRLRLL